MKNLALIFAFAIATFGAETSAQPQLAIQAGAFDFAQQDDPAGLIAAEYRFASIYRGLRPVAGAFVTSDSGVYGYGGMQWDIFLTDHLVIAPQLAAGLYGTGAGKDLFHAIELRSQLELGYEFDDKTRLTAAISHISNASLGDDNPGAEMLSVGYAFPVNF